MCYCQSHCWIVGIINAFYLCTDRDINSKTPGGCCKSYTLEIFVPLCVYNLNHVIIYAFLLAVKMYHKISHAKSLSINICIYVFEYLIYKYTMVLFENFKWQIEILVILNGYFSSSLYDLKLVIQIFLPVNLLIIFADI